MNLRLNLMPWREQRRAKAIRRFQSTLVTGLVVALGLVVLLDQLARARLARQAATIVEQQAVIERLDDDWDQLEEARSAHRNVQERYAALVALRAAQASLPQLLMALEKAMPPGAQLTSLDIKDARLQLSGLAASASVVAQLMRELQASGVVDSLELVHLRHRQRGDEFLLVGDVAGGHS